MTYSTHLFRHLRFMIGQNIQTQRVRQNLLLHKLAHLSRVPEARLDHYELGKSEIKLNELLRIACALEVEIGDLMPEKCRL